MLNLCSRCSATLLSGADDCPRCGLSQPESKARSSPGEGVRERRVVTVVFTDLAGYTEWNEEAEPEEVAAMMERIQRHAVQTFEAYGGVANQFVGDEILGLFGVGRAHEDDPNRAVLATLALHAYVRAQVLYRANGAPRALRMHSGIETGIVYVRAHDPRSGLWDVTGDSVNTAARLRSLASEDEILVGPNTHALIAPYFEVTPLPPVVVRGKIAPLASYRVLHARAAPSRFEVARSRGLTQYVERAEAMAKLYRALADARSGRGRTVCVVAPPGMGKTRLFYEFRRQVARERPLTVYVAHGRSVGYGEVALYQPFVDAILGRTRDRPNAGAHALERLRRLKLLSPEALRALAMLLAPERVQSRPLEGELLRDSIEGALIELARSTAARKPLLLLLEDWHWADEPSRSALRRMAEALRDARVLIAVNQRPLEGASNAESLADEVIALEPLDRDSTKTLACASLSQAELPDELVAFVHERAHGIPFFVEEICRSLLDEGLLDLDPPSLRRALSEVRTPSTVQSIVRGRIDALPPRQRALLRVSAVIGGEFSLELLERLSAERESSLENLLLSLESHGLVYRAGSAMPPRYRFKHAITQEVAYESVPTDERRWLHAHAARYFEQTTEPGELEAKYELLAHHYAHSADPERALHYAALAGDKAWRAFSLKSAETYYRRALELLDGRRADAEVARRYVEVSTRWARVALYNPHLDQIAALRRAHELAQSFGDARGACLCYNWMSWIEYALGNHANAVHASREFLRRAEALGDAALIAQAFKNLGLSHAIAAEHDLARELIERGIAERGRFQGTAYAYSLGYLAMIAGDQGDFETARERLEQAARIVVPSARPTLLGPYYVQRAMVDSWRGDWASAREHARSALAIAQHIEGTYIRAMALTFEGHAAFAASRGRDGLPQLREAQALLEQSHIGLHASLATSALADALAKRGEAEDATRFAQQALAQASRGDRFGEVMALRALARIRVHRNRDRMGARALIEQAEEASDAKFSPRERYLTELCWAELLAFLGAHEESKSLLAEVTPKLLALGMQGFLKTT